MNEFKVEDRVGCKRYFAKYEDGNIYAWNCGETSWSASTPLITAVWKYAKLADKE